MKRIKSLRIILVVTLLLWSIGPAAALAGEGIPTGQMDPFRISVSPTVDFNEVGQAHTFTILLERYSGEVWVNAGGYTVDHTYTSPSGVGFSSSGTTDSNGTIAVTVNSLNPGQGSLIASFGGVTSNTALKYWEEWKVEITPASAVNPVGEPHAFKVSLFYDIGSGWTKTTAGQQIDLSFNGPGHFVSINGVPAGGQSGTGATDGIGEIAVVAASDLAGTSTLTASFGVTTTSGNVTYTGSADKTWRAGGAITGTVFHDVNANGSQDAGEPPLPGWTVTLYAEDGTTILATALSDEDGGYTFADLKPGIYYVAESLEGHPEWNNTTPIKSKFQVIYDVEMNEIYVTPIDVNFGNEKPFLGFQADTNLLPYTGGMYHPTLPAMAGPKHAQGSNPLRQTSNGLLGALAMVMLALAAVMIGSARARKVFL